MIRRTVVFNLDPTEEQRAALAETQSLYTIAWQHSVDVAWNMEKISATAVHKQVYSHLKTELRLKSQYLCSSRNRAVESVKSARDREKKGRKVSKPTSNTIPVRLDQRTLSFDKPMEMASIATQKGRIKIPLNWHTQAQRYRDWSCKAGEFTKNRKGYWVLRLIFEKESPPKERSDIVVGIDRGIRHPAVTSSNQFLGSPEWKEHERKLLSLRSKLQSKGTKSAKRRLKKLSGRLRRFKTDCDRVLAKDLMDKLNIGDTIVLEDLRNIKKRCGVKGKARKKHRSNMGRWSYKRLACAVTNLAESKGVFVESIEPAYTSQTCSKCSIIKKSNRKNQSSYKCSCGLQLNADLNAARNIEYLWRQTNGLPSGLSVNQPIVGVTYNHVATYKPSTSVEGN